jgi:hypothetical protein
MGSDSIPGQDPFDRRSIGRLPQLNSQLLFTDRNRSVVPEEQLMGYTARQTDSD